LFANPDVKLGRVQPKSFGNDALSQRNAGFLYDWPIGAYDYNHIHPQPSPKWSLPLLAHRTAPSSSSSSSSSHLQQGTPHHNVSTPSIVLKHNQRLYPKVNTHIVRMFEMKDEDVENMENKNVNLIKESHESQKIAEEEEKPLRHQTSHEMMKDSTMVYGDAGTMLSFNIDVSQVGCGCTAALYMVAMPSDSERTSPGTCREVHALIYNIYNIHIRDTYV
jgi:hypothetical protein